ncbi:uncharacterized protein LOC129300062 [Prosopis cineraria]|uniref:uncharacterized protein LOC129300062 n=1 Tax=Prosopis cineraria TaxID=364024 RepID=UPI00240EA988|nr:uncharacterized protein LOC129300062 [Prosopis cineraria]XP_054794562.1 uncharacterized protein LOC129300062 [Prosopis cineraria]
MAYAHSASLVWADLKERFDKVTGSSIFAIHREINSHVQGSLTVSSYYTRLKELWEEQSFLIAVPTCKCETSKVYFDLMQQQRLLQFLKGLSESYSQARSQILLMTPLPSVNQAYNMIMEDEAQKLIAGSNKSSPIEGATMAVGRGQGRGRGRGRGNSSLECAHCHKRGHVKENCYEIIGYPVDFKGKNKNKRSQEIKSNQGKGEAANGVDEGQTVHQPLFKNSMNKYCNC